MNTEHCEAAAVPWWAVVSARLLQVPAVTPLWLPTGVVMQLAEISSPVLSRAVLSTAITASGDEATAPPNTSTLRVFCGQANEVVQNCESAVPALARTVP
jgi:hypothetical protein